MEEFTTLEVVLLSLKKKALSGGIPVEWDGKCLYASKPLCAQSRYQLTDRCCLAAGTTVDNDDVEHLPPEIEAKGLGLYCYGNNLMDVVESAVHQRPDVSAEGLLQALNYHKLNDSFIEYSKMAKRPKIWNIGIFPKYSATQLRAELSARKSDVLSKGCLLEYPAGSVLLESGDSEVGPLCNLISYQSEWALYLYLSLPSVESEGRWSHILYQKYPVSPKPDPQDAKKTNQYRMIADATAFSQAFTGTEPEILEHYLQSDSKIRDAQQRWEKYMVRCHRQRGWQPPVHAPVCRVRPTDDYDSSDWRQVFDFLRYLSFPLEGEIK